jgi:hypothetical protein
MRSADTKSSRSADGAFDHIAEMAATFFRVPIAIVSLVEDQDRIWFKAHHVIEANQVERDSGLCASAILSPEVYYLRDITKFVDFSVESRTVWIRSLRSLPADARSFRWTSPDRWHLGCITFAHESRDPLSSHRSLATTLRKSENSGV